MESRNTSFFNMCLHVNSSIIQVRLNKQIMLSLKIVKNKNKKNKKKVQDSKQEVHFEPRRSKRARTEKNFDPKFLTFLPESKRQSFMEGKSSPEGTL